MKKLSYKENLCDKMRETPRQLSSPDLGSPEKVWKYLCKKDEKWRRDENLFSKHPELTFKMRSVLLEWLMEVAGDRKLHRETFHLSIDYIDKYLEKTRNLLPYQLQLVGSTALVIATKIEEIYPPKISDIADFTDGTCTEADIRSLEETMLTVLEWNCTPITSIHWLGLYLQLMNSSEIVPEFSMPKPCVRRRCPHHASSNTSLQNSCSNNSSLNESQIENLPKKNKGLTNNSLLEFNENKQLNFSFNSSYSTEEISYIDSYSNIGNEHIYPDQRCTVPKLMRDEFIRLAMILDVILLDAESLQFKYSELAAAVIWCCYEPENLIREVTGFKREDLSDVFEFVEPYVLLCENLEPAGISIPSYSDVLAEDAHNIQTYIPNVLKYLDEIERQKRETKGMRLRSNLRCRKRKLCELNGN